MRYSLIHVHDPEVQGEDPRLTDPHEEVMVIVPDGRKLAVGVPLRALPRYLEIMHQALGDAPAACCPECGEVLTVPPDRLPG